MTDLIEDLQARGLVVQTSDPLWAEHLRTGKRTLYCGFDPTAPSLHIGNLVPLLTLRRFQLAGHRPICLIGGATGMIGDPSGKSEERNLNDDALVHQWVERIQQQVEPLLDFHSSDGALLVNNLDWTREMDVISFLRDVGKHFAVNAMIQRDSVRSRLEREGEGISFTEFSYMLLQSMDFFELHQRQGCTMQIGGNDQWGNIVSGVDLVRRRASELVFAVTLPLITKADGSKFGKTASGTIWLDPEKTSAYAFYQFWLNTADADVVNFLKIFTFMSLDEIAKLEQAVTTAPEQRVGQHALADSVTALVHGEGGLVSAKRITQALFQGDIEALTEMDLEQLALDGMEATTLNTEKVGLLAAMADGGVAPSRGGARKLVQSGGVRLNGVVQQDIERELDWTDALFGRFYLLRRGKKAWYLLRRD